MSKTKSKVSRPGFIDIVEGYTIVAKPDEVSITCHRCGMTSHNPNDARHRYCSRCQGFYVRQADL